MGSVRKAKQAIVDVEAGIGVLATLSGPVMSRKITRVSCVHGDPGYQAYAMLRADNRYPRVCLDGVEQKHCITADTEEGFVERVVVNARGVPEHDGENVITEIARGIVTIEQAG